MKLSIISFTEHGMWLSKRIGEALKEQKEEKEEIEATLFTKCKACMNGEILYDVHQPILPVEVSVGDWAKSQMQERNAMLFIGACGIAVRAIAPSLTDKLHDAPVLVMDEMGEHIIPILSGHMGGANELAVYLAKKTGAEPIITTATDINKKFAVDVFARKNGLFIVNKDGIAKVSSKVLAGEAIAISVEPGHETYGAGEGGKTENACLPKESYRVPYPPAGSVDVVVTSEEGTFDASILLRPKEYIIGMGCRRGKEAKEIEDFILRKTGELGISIAQIFALSSVSQKRDEQGIIEWCQKEGIPFLTYTAEELQKVKGEFHTSSFVKDKVGVDNVCERAALKACGPEGTLVCNKCAENGMTIAIAKRAWKIES